MAEFERTATYTIKADDLDHAEEVWAEDGPELSDTRTIDGGYGDIRPVADSYLEQRANAIADLDEDTRELVLDALRVRAMDFVQDRLVHNDGASDMAADIHRLLVPATDDVPTFDPNFYGRES